MKRHVSRSTSSCAACKFLKRKCATTCIFAPYFQSNETLKFAKIHRVFGASNASKLLSEVPQELRAETLNSLVYEAEARLNDPVHGCIGAMASLQHRMMQLQHDLAVTRAHLACYVDCGSPTPVAYTSDLSSSSLNGGAAPFRDYSYINHNEDTSEIPSSFQLQQPDETLSNLYGNFCQP